MQELLEQRILCRRSTCVAALLSHNFAFGFVAVAADAPAAFCQHHRFHRHLIHSERAGFIRTDNGHGAQGFDRRQFADNRIGARHRLHT